MDSIKSIGEIKDGLWQIEFIGGRRYEISGCKKNDRWYNQALAHIIKKEESGDWNYDLVYKFELDAIK